MNDPSSFDGVSPPLDGHAYAVRTQVLGLDEARALSSFVKPVSLFDKWQALPGTIPHQKNISPAFVGVQILPEMYILDIVSQQGVDVDFRWRLFGTAHSDRYGKEATGVLLSEAASRDQSAAGSYKVAQQVMRTHKAAFFLSEFIENDIVHKSTSTVVMPLSDDAGEISRLFGCSAWSRF